jgi:anti-anti-sigma factor
MIMTVTTDVPEQLQSTGFVDRRTASVSLHSRGQATVITVTGEIDASNADFLITVLSGFAAQEGSLVLDLSDLEFFGAQGLRVLSDFDQQCRRAGSGWALVPPRMLRRMMQVIDIGQRLPVSNSADDAVKALERPSTSSALSALPCVAKEKLRC